MQRKSYLIILLSLVLAFSLSSERSSLAQPAPSGVTGTTAIEAAITPLMSYQGRLVEGGAPVSGTRSMTFSLYNASSAGTLLWSEVQSVTVTNGLFQVALGSVTPFSNTVVGQMSQNLWLEINVAGTILPRQQLMGAPYAFSLAPGATVAGSSDSQILAVGNTSSGSGAWGYSGTGHGVVASSYGSGLIGSALLAEAYGSGGIAVWALADSTDSSLVVSNDGGGDLVRGFGGDGGEFEFAIDNNGSFIQEREASGLVKAAVLALCADGQSQIVRSFNNVGGTISISYIVKGACSIDFGFAVNDRYYMVTAPALEDYTEPVHAVCGMDPGDTTEITCVLQHITGNFLDGYIMIVIY